MTIVTAIFLCLIIVVQLGLCLFYMKLAKVEWPRKKLEGLFYGMMSVITFCGAGLIGLWVLVLLGFNL